MPSDQDQVIGLKDVYEQVVRLVGFMEAVTERNRQADAVHQDHEQRLRVLEQRPNPTDHESRLRALERWRYALPASITVGGGGLATALVALIGHH